MSRGPGGAPPVSRSVTKGSLHLGSPYKALKDQLYKSHASGFKPP